MLNQVQHDGVVVLRTARFRSHLAPPGRYP